jgi:hypothetical protein
LVKILWSILTIYNFKNIHPSLPRNSISRDSKMAARGEEAESMPPKVKSWRDAGDTLYRKTTENRQNCDSSTPPACTEHLHLTLNGETKRAPALPDASIQTTWEEADHKVS